MTNKRLMLGITGPTLLVGDIKTLTDTSFRFWVVNGAWEGIFDNSKVFVLGNDNDHVIEGIKILCDDQLLLSGSYAEVFDRVEHWLETGEKLYPQEELKDSSDDF